MAHAAEDFTRSERSEYSERSEQASLPGGQEPPAGELDVEPGIPGELAELVLNPVTACYDVAGRPDLVVIGFCVPAERFIWINDEIDDIEHPDLLTELLGEELQVLPAFLGAERGEAWCISRSRLAALTGRPGDAQRPFAALARLAAAWFAQRDER